MTPPTKKNNIQNFLIFLKSELEDFPYL